MRFHEQFRTGHLRAWTQQLAIISLLMLAPAAGAGSKYKVLYAFKGGNDGIDPQGNLVFDAAGNLYGTTTEGGGTTNCNGVNKGCGTVFQLLPPTSGQWKENVLYSFPNGASEGVGLNGNLIFDTAGNLYGTAFYGGAGFTGAVFELTSGSGDWTEKDIYTFCPAGCSDGESPGSGVIFDDAGNLYGTADQGGTDGGGVIFKLAPDSGSWTESVLFDFCPFKPCNSGGWFPFSLSRDASGNLYGATAWGGNYFWPCIPGDGCGAVFELSPKSGGGWDYNVLHRFTGRDGAFANSGVILNQQGNVYGTTTNDGAFGCGAVFELSPKAGGGWTYNTLYNLRGGISAGTLAMDSLGNLYVANSGIMSGSCRGPADGEVFKLSPLAHGHWKYSSVHKLNGGQGGGTASSGLIFDKQGNLYGTAAAEGAHGYGVVFELTP
jgi:uncharacterized repeat protein (TIGR03803 family)